MSLLHALATTPPLGWNSFDCYNASVTEAEVRANAEVLARQLAPFGWEYVVVDFCWSHPRPQLENSPDLPLRFDGSVAPLLTLDEFSRQIPAVDRFPSAADGQGFAPLGDYIHSLGLKFGIHMMRGIPRQAAEANLPIVGGYHARDIARPDSICPWLNHMYGVDMEQPGAQTYYNSLFVLYAAWGVDYVKVDDISYPYQAAEIEAIHMAMEACGRPMVLSLSPGPAPLDSRSHLRRHANLWRISADFWDSWEQLRAHFALCRAWTPHIAVGHWPDADMLPLGRLSLRGPQAEPRWSRLSHTEQRTLMTLFVITRSPLMIGSDLPSADAFTLSLLTNSEVLGVNQHSCATRVLLFHEDAAVWAAEAPDGGGQYLALFNLSDEERAIPIDLGELNCRGPVIIRDLWAQHDLPDRQEDCFAPRIAAHGSGLYQVGAF